MYRGYNEKMVRKEILRARAIPRDAVLEKVNNQEKQNKITFNITYHPVFRDVRKILEELHVIPASEDEHKKVFPDVPMIGFKNNKNLKAHLVRSQLPDLDEVGRSKPCGGKSKICCEQYTGSTKTKFRSRANNYKSTQRKFMNKEAVPKQALKQKRFHEHYCSVRHNGIEDWVINLIDSADTLKGLRRKELYWVYRLKTYAPYGLNESDVYEAF